MKSFSAATISDITCIEVQNNRLKISSIYVSAVISNEIHPADSCSITVHHLTVTRISTAN